MISQLFRWSTLVMTLVLVTVALRSPVITVQGFALSTATPRPPTPTQTVRPPTPTSTPRPPTPTPSATLTLTPSPTQTPTETPACQVAGLLATQREVAWVGSGDEQSHVGDDNLYAGIYFGRIYHGALQFNLEDLPDGVHLHWARVSLTGQTTAFLGLDGQWRLQFMGPEVDEWWPAGSFDQIHNAQVLFTVPPVLERQDLAAGLVNVFAFTPEQLPALQERLQGTRRASLRLDGPQEGPNNVFSWDSGYGPDSIGRPPLLVICYSMVTPRPPTATATPRPPTPTVTLTSTPRPPTATSTPRPPTPGPTATPGVYPSPATTESAVAPSPTPTPGAHPGPASTEGLLVEPDPGEPPDGRA